MEGLYNRRSPAVKRLMREAQELSEPTEQYYAQPLEDNLFEWHFTIRGPADSEFDAGIFHGRIILPPEYPMKPPSIILLTPNGRFEVYKKICLSISGHHPESWQPSWSIRTALLAIIGFMPTHGNGALGSLDYTPEERKVLAKKSVDFKCTECGSIKNILKPVTEASEATKKEAQELAAQMNFQGEKEKKAAEAEGEESTTSSSTPSSSATITTPPNTPISPVGPTPPLASFSPGAAGAAPGFVPPAGMFPQMRFPFPPPFAASAPGQQAGMPWSPQQFQAMMQAQAQLQAQMQAQMRMAGFPVPPMLNAAAPTQGATSAPTPTPPSSSSSATVQQIVAVTVPPPPRASSSSSTPVSVTTQATTTLAPAATSPLTAAAAAASTTTAAASSSTTSPTVPATTTSSSPSSSSSPAAASTTPATTVRRRATVTTPQTPQSAELPPTHGAAANRRPASHQSMGVVTLSIIVLISLALLLLVLRRLHMMSIVDLSFIFN